MQRIAYGLLWCFVFTVPWENVVQLPGLGSVPRLVGIAATISGVLFVAARGRFRPLSWFHILACLFVVWAAVTALWSIDVAGTRERVMTYAQLALLTWLLWELAPSSQQQRAFLRAYVLGASFAAATVISNYIAGVSLVEERFSALNANPNELGLTLVLGLPMAWYLATSLGTPRSWVWHLYAPLALTAVLLTASRGAFVAALVALLLVPWALGRLRLRTRVVLCVLAGGSLWLAQSFVPQASLERLSGTRADIARGDFGGRGVIWMAGLQVAAEHPISGVGAGAFGAAVEPLLRIRWNSHATFLSVLVEEGVIGLSIFLAMIATTLMSFRTLRPAQQRFAVLLLTVLLVGTSSAAWDYRKQLWFVLGLLAVQGAVRFAPEAAATRRLVPAEPVP